MHGIRTGSPCNYKAITKPAVSNPPWRHATGLWLCSSPLSSALAAAHPARVSLSPPWGGTGRHGLCLPLPQPLRGCTSRLLQDPRREKQASRQIRSATTEWWEGSAGHAPIATASGSLLQAGGSPRSPGGRDEDNFSTVEISHFTQRPGGQHGRHHCCVLSPLLFSCPTRAPGKSHK